MTVGDVRDVLARYLRAVQDEVLADGHVTDEERARCRAVVTELKIPPALWPGEIRAIVSLWRRRRRIGQTVSAQSGPLAPRSGERALGRGVRRQAGAGGDDRFVEAPLQDLLGR